MAGGVLGGFSAIGRVQGVWPHGRWRLGGVSALLGVVDPFLKSRCKSQYSSKA